MSGVAVPTMDDYTAMDKRVATLEAAQGGTKPSAEGTKVSTSGSIVVADDGSQWRLDSTAPNMTISWAPKGSTTFGPAGNTAKVSAILKQAGIHQTSPNPSGITTPGWWVAAWSGTTFTSWTAEQKPSGQ